MDTNRRVFQVKHKFMFAVAIATAWFFLVCWINLSWIIQLSDVIGWFGSISAISLIAIIPSFWYAFTIVSFLVDNRPEAKEPESYPSLTVLVAAYNEEKVIAHTLKTIQGQDYPSRIEIIVIDDGSTDETMAILKSLPDKNIKVIAGQHQGKAASLNLGLAAVTTDLIITVDADTHLLPHSIKQIVRHLLSSLPDTAAVAGCVCVKNSRASAMSKMQEWNYFNEITATKRLQSLYQGTLVAQGAFSIYRKAALLAVGGFPLCLGEDIVLTWSLLEHNYRVGFAEQAYAFTDVPVTYKKLFYQRSRWMSGMLEALFSHPKLLFKNRLSTMFIWWNLTIPFLDLGYALIFIPGVIAACFGYLYIVGPMTLSLVPLVILSNFIYYYRSNKLFEKNKLVVRKNVLGLLFYMFLYQPVVSVPSALHGYYRFFFGRERSWGTK
jgi:biofilm PGA synthesis N-glycosyltransferase PgaC